MSFDSFFGGESYDLRGRPGALHLEDGGIRHPTSPSGRGSAFTPYDEVTHIATSSRALWLGTRRSLYLVSRAAFARSDGPEQFGRALLKRLAETPEGTAHLQRMAAVEQTARAPARPRATWMLGLACLAVYAVHLLLGQPVHEVGYFSAALVLDGDLWRIVTANLIHGFPEVPFHLGLNLVALVILGTILERALGSARTLLVIGASGVGAMLAAAMAGQSEVVGVSGVVFGLFGGILWLELRCAESLPAWWRVPRRSLWVLLLVNLALPFLVPVISGAAHAGGLVLGMLATAFATGADIRPLAAPAWTRAAAAGVVLLGVVAILNAGNALLREDDFLASHAARLATLPGILPSELNNRAWIIAIDPEASEAQVEAALRLAERAVDETQRLEATILDTLAEVQFALGMQAEAVATIEEAIARAPHDHYYREQRRRFTGERAPEDRPVAPGVPLPGPWEHAPEPFPPEEDSGITV